MAKEVIVTDEGLKKLEQELEELKTIKRKEVAELAKIPHPAEFEKYYNL